MIQYGLIYFVGSNKFCSPSRVTVDVRNYLYIFMRESLASGWVEVVVGAIDEHGDGRTGSPHKTRPIVSTFSNFTFSGSRFGHSVCARAYMRKIKPISPAVPLFVRYVRQWWAWCRYTFCIAQAAVKVCNIINNGSV